MAPRSGKSTLAKTMQQALPEPFLPVSPDHPVASGMLPARREPDGPFAWWQQMRPRSFDGFHRCLPALAKLLDGLDVFLAGVHCDLAEIDRRERDRGDRRIGEGRPHVETGQIHTSGPYDFGIDTADAAPSAVAASVLAACGPAPAEELCRKAYLATEKPYPRPSPPHSSRQKSEFAAQASVHASACRINGMEAISTPISASPAPRKR